MRSKLINSVVSWRESGHTWSDIAQAAREQYPKEIKGNFSPEAARSLYRREVSRWQDTRGKPHPHEDFTRDALGHLPRKLKAKRGRFFITAASPTSHRDDVAGLIDGHTVYQNLHKGALDAVLGYCGRMDAELIIHPMRAHTRALRKQPAHYDPRLREHIDCFATDVQFNVNLRSIDAYVNPQQANPLTGLKRLRGRGGDPHTSVIVAHSKQMMEVVPTGNSTVARIIHSTGAITLPSYLRNRVGRIADDDHTLGGLIVEINGDVFHLRQVQFDPTDGSFVDLGVRYFSDGTYEHGRAEAVKFGDIHAGLHSDEALAFGREVCDITKPKRVFLEDFLDGGATSHHIQHNKFEQWKLPEVFKDIKSELQVASELLEDIRGWIPQDAELVLTASNHPGHLMRYLDECRYVRDNAVNFEMGHRMQVLRFDGKNPIIEYLDPEHRHKWLGDDDDYLIDQVQWGAHGHLGPNGSRGTPKNLEPVYRDAVTAHTHTPGIHYGMWTAGHMSQDRHGYNRGPSGWLTALVVQYTRGCRQLIIQVHGKWRLT